MAHPNTTTTTVTRKSRRTDLHGTLRGSQPSRDGTSAAEPPASRRAAGKRSTPPAPPSTDADVARRAYLIYLEEGCPQGRHLDHWLRAENELRTQF